MANRITITTPRGSIYHMTGKNGKVTARLEWNAGFGREKTASFTRAQMFVDSEVLRFCSSRVPFDTGMLQKSGILGTVVGSGEVRYIAPYAAKQYYHTAPTRSYDANRGGMWFERGKAVERDHILRGAQKIAEGRR
jgi:hypothetical protein|nr:MAG TPA: Minor capsid protein [Caudoviricetes sp.]